MAKPTSRKMMQACHIHQLDGGLAGKMIDQEIAKIYNDLKERSDDGKPRKLAIEVEFIAGKRGLTEITLKCQAKLPMNVGRVTKSKADKNAGALVFRTSAPDNPDQTTFEDVVDFSRVEHDRDDNDIEPDNDDDDNDDSDSTIDHETKGNG